VPQPQRDANILLVEDDPDSASMFTQLLRLHGYRVSTASTVEQALEIARTNDCDVLISDIRLPDGSGLDLVRRLGAQRSITAIALTGFGRAEDVRQSRAAGFRAHLVKPVSMPVLLETIERVTRNATETHDGFG
jgi:DNA-binding response OmpR family regulator